MRKEKQQFAPRATSRLVTVRLDLATRERLDALAAASDRTLAQLARYALSAYFTLPDTPAPSPGLPEEREASGTRHVTLRLPEQTSEEVAAYAASCAVTASDVIRHALSLWLDSDAPASLGAPAAAGEKP